MKSFLEKWSTFFFMLVGLFISILLAEAIILALVNQFKTLFIYLSLIPAFIITKFFSTYLKRKIEFLPKITLPVLILIFFISLILAFYPHDTFGGRDEAIYSNYAVHLAQNGSLNFSSYLNNLPDSFVENVKITPPGYIIYLATQQVFFGTQGLLHGNLIIIILGLSSFFLVSSYLGGNKIGLIATVLFSLSMPFLWFSRETMSENLSFFLLWSLILFFFIFLRTKRFVYLSVIFLCSWLFALTRLEGFLLQFILLLMIPSTLFFLKSTGRKNILYITLFFLLVVVSNVIIARTTFVPFLTKTIQGVNYSFRRDISSLIPKNLPNNKIKYSNIDTSKQPKFNNLPLFIFLMMAKYNFILVILAIFLITNQFLIRFKKLDKSKKFFFIILILLIPEYYKIINPNVTIDQPWLYRRYMYALLPLGYLCLTILLSQLKNKKLSIILLSSLFTINIILSNPIIFLKNNWTLIDRLNEITKDISQNDFVIIENWTLGYYYPSSFLILNKGVRSAFASTINQPQFLPDRKIFNGINYKKIFLLSTNNKDNYPSFNIVSRKSVDVEYSQLVPSCQLFLLGKEEGLANPYNIGALYFSDVIKYCSQPKNEIIKYNEKIYLYELIYK